MTALRGEHRRNIGCMKGKVGCMIIAYSDMFVRQSFMQSNKAAEHSVIQTSPSEPLPSPAEGGLRSSSSYRAAH